MISTHHSLNLLSQNVNNALFQHAGLNTATAAGLGLDFLVAPATVVLGIAAGIGITRWWCKKMFR